MKLHLLGLLIVALLLSGCLKDQNSDDKILDSSLNFIGTEKRGCFTLKSETNHIMEFGNDTLYYTLANDILIFSLHINENCAAVLIDSVQVMDSSIQVYVKNTSDAIANCICSFELDYLFQKPCYETSFTVFYKTFNATDYVYWDSVNYP